MAVIVFILVPIALISFILATTTYRSVSRSIEASQIELGSNYAVRARVWFRGTLRVLAAASASLQTQKADSATCSRSAENIRLGTAGVHAIYVTFPESGVHCFGSGFPHLAEQDLADLLAGQAAKARLSLWGGQEIGEARYDVVSVGSHKHLLVYLRIGDHPGGVSESILLLDPELLDTAFGIGDSDRNTIIALVNRGQDVIVARGVDESVHGWLPSVEKINGAIRRDRLQSRDGGEYIYVSQMIAQPDLYVIARFGNQAAQAAFTQFLVLCLTPLAMLAVLFATYVWAIEGNVLRSLRVIERAARARREGRRELVDITEPMPSDIKLLAQSFNEMVADADSRETALRAAFEANQYLMRELHHRVKNSLQVIQSYLALSRRLQKRNNERPLIETEAKVQVLSTAYRLALLEGSMRPVPLGVFANEILENLGTALRRPHQWIEIDINTDAGLIVDRTIPIGLALVEAVAAGLQGESARNVHVSLNDLDNGQIEMNVSSDGTPDPTQPPPKIMTGLALQIGATASPVAPGTILSWRFVP